MSQKLDDELARAIEASEAEADKAGGKRGGVDDPADDDGMSVANEREIAHKPRRNVGFLAVLLVMVAGMVGLFAFGFKEAAIYAMPAKDLLAQSDKMVGKKVRVEGMLVKGSLFKQDEPCEYRFTLTSDGAVLPVRYKQCVIPEIRDQEGVELTIEGALTEEKYFDATLVMAQCASKYDPETHELETDGSAAPRKLEDGESGGEAGSAASRATPGDSYAVPVSSVVPAAPR